MKKFIIIGAIILSPSFAFAQQAKAPVTDIQLEQERSAMYATQVQYLSSIVERLQAQMTQKDADWAKYSESLWKPYQTSEVK